MVKTGAPRRVAPDQLLEPGLVDRDLAAFERRIFFSSLSTRRLSLACGFSSTTAPPSARTGVGETVSAKLSLRLHRGASRRGRRIASSWKDRPAARLAHELGARRRPQSARSVLNYLWHRAEWPTGRDPLAGGRCRARRAPCSFRPGSAAQVVTIHDLFFLEHPERVREEIARTIPALALLMPGVRTRSSRHRYARNS